MYLSDIGYFCAYRNAGGLRCLVGYFIPDEKYSHDIGGKAVMQMPVINAIPESIKNVPGALELIRDLQKSS